MGNFSDIARAKQRVIQKAAIADDGSLDDEITDLLEASKAKSGEDDEYRPYIVAAYMLRNDKSGQLLVEAVGEAKFRQANESMNNQPTIEGLVRTQASFDAALHSIPCGWGTQTFLDSICGCLDDGQASGAASDVYGLGAMVV